jgi:hypothetical protein
MEKWKEISGKDLSSCIAACVCLSRKLVTNIIFSLCIKFYLFPRQVFLYRYTYGTLTREAATEHWENGISRPWKSIKKRNSIGTEAVIYDGGCDDEKRNECDHKQVFKVTFSWEINWNLWSWVKKCSLVMFLCDMLHAILDERVTWQIETDLLSWITVKKKRMNKFNFKGKELLAN